MKDYKRLTEEHINDAEFCSGCGFDDDLNGCEIGGCDKYYMYFETYEKLRKLEDKIESGELISKKEVERLQTENAELHERLERSIELPFFQEDGEARILVYRDKNGIVCTEIYFEDEIYWGRHGDEAAEARFEEIRKDD